MDQPSDQNLYSFPNPISFGDLADTEFNNNQSGNPGNSNDNKNQNQQSLHNNNQYRQFQPPLDEYVNLFNVDSYGIGNSVSQNQNTNLNDKQQSSIPFNAEFQTNQLLEYPEITNGFLKNKMRNKSSNQQVSLNMPGAFKNNNNDLNNNNSNKDNNDDFNTNSEPNSESKNKNTYDDSNYNNMEVDESPPFTIELELFYDTILDGNNTNLNDGNENGDKNRNYFDGRTQNVDSPGIQVNLPTNYDNESLFIENQYHNNNSKINQESNELYAEQFDNNSIVFSHDGRLQHSSSFLSMNNVYNTQSENNNSSKNFDDGHLRNVSNDSYQNSQLINQVSQFDQSHNTYNQNINNSNNSANYGINELSPLTTTTSLTPSLNSIHSTQPSFFSANQYFPRNSLDQSQSQSNNRTSFDLHSKNRQSMDSQSSANHVNDQRNQRYNSFTNSISNYIPFMSDKNNQRSGTSSGSGPPSPISQPSPTNFLPLQNNLQSKHLIRSIFKVNNQNSNNEQNNNLINKNNNNTINTHNDNDANDTNNANSTIESFNNSGIYKNARTFGDSQNNEDKHQTQSFLQNENFMEGIINENEFLVMSPAKDEVGADSQEPLNAHPKAKRSKRSLFTRFKSPMKAEPIDGSIIKSEPIDEIVKHEDQDSSNFGDVNNQNQNSAFLKNDNESSDQSIIGNGSFQASSVSRTPSATQSLFQTNNNSLQYTTLNHSGNNNYSQPPHTQQFQQPLQSEPDYAALFEKVGKRKNIVNPSTYMKSKPKLKNEADINSGSNSSNNNSTSNTEKSSILNAHVGYDSNADENLNISASSSNASSFNYGSLKQEDPDQATSSNTANNPNSTNNNNNKANNGNNNAGSSIATASKRILGSKLMLKKKNQQYQLQQQQLVQEQLQQQLDNGQAQRSSVESEQKDESTPKFSELQRQSSEEVSIKSSKSNGSEECTSSVATMISKGVEVEVDLKSLDLPANTKIFPSSIINSKSRIRGRKENKQADMVDQSKIYLCNYCSRRFKRQEHLKRHFRSLHTFEKPYDCTICNKKFSRSDNLNQHLKIHKLEEEEAAAKAAAKAGSKDDSPTVVDEE